MNQKIIYQNNELKTSTSPTRITNRTVHTFHYIDQKIGNWIIHTSIMADLQGNPLMEVTWLNKITKKGIKLREVFLK